MKKVSGFFAAVAVMVAIGGAFASDALFTNSTKYKITGGCSAIFQTVEDNCTTSNTGAQCHVFVSASDQSRLAFDATNCAVALKQP
jgi:hypothetical protein